MSRHTVRAATTIMVRANLLWLSAAVATLALGYAAFLAGTAIWTEAAPIWASVNWFLHWAALAAGLGVASTVPVLVAHGLTRRTVVRAGSVAVLAIAAGMALVVQAGLVLEWTAFRLAGSPYVVDGGHLFDTVAQAHLVLVEYGLQFAGFLVAGWLTLTVYQRVGARWGTLALPLNLVPGAAAVFAVTADWRGGDPSGTALVDNAIALVLAAAVVAAGLLVVGVLARRAPVTSST